MDTETLVSAHELGHVVHAMTAGARCASLQRDPDGWTLKTDEDWATVNPTALLPQIGAGLAAGAAGEHIARLLADGVTAALVPFRIQELWRDGKWWTEIAGHDKENVAILLEGGVNRDDIETDLMGCVDTLTRLLAMTGPAKLRKLGVSILQMDVGQSVDMRLPVLRAQTMLSRSH
jgi:hypothetical protein